MMYKYPCLHFACAAFWRVSPDQGVRPLEATLALVREHKDWIWPQITQITQIIFVLGCTADQAYQPATTQYQIVFLICVICVICGQIQCFTVLAPESDL